jgi:hypothetical protein
VLAITIRSSFPRGTRSLIVIANSRPSEPNIQDKRSKLGLRRKNAKRKTGCLLRSGR